MKSNLKQQNELREIFLLLYSQYCKEMRARVEKELLNLEFLQETKKETVHITLPSLKTYILENISKHTKLDEIVIHKELDKWLMKK